MNTSPPLCLALLAVLFISPAKAQPSHPWSQGSPTPEEQQAMEWLNASRKDPPGTLAGILNLAASDSVIAGFMLAQAPATAAQFEQWLQASWQNAQADSVKFPSSEAISQAPLAFYPLFQQQAAALGAGAIPPPLGFPAQRLPPAYIYPVPVFGEALLSGPANVQVGPNATGGTAEFGPYGANYTEVSQANLYDSSITPREWMLTNLTASYPAGTWSPSPNFLLQGDSLPNLSLGHTRMVGIDISPGQNGNQILTLVKGSSEFFTQSDLPFGAPNTVFITGVAYQDNNSNGLYDPGEGLSGVSVIPDHGGWYAVTSSSGGYAIPVPANSGPYVLTATGRGLAGATATVTVGADSVKSGLGVAGRSTGAPSPSRDSALRRREPAVRPFDPRAGRIRGQQPHRRFCHQRPADRAKKTSDPRRRAFAPNRGFPGRRVHSRHPNRTHFQFNRHCLQSRLDERSRRRCGRRAGGRASRRLSARKLGGRRRRQRLRHHPLAWRLHRPRFARNQHGAPIPNRLCRPRRNL